MTESAGPRQQRLTNVDEWVEYTQTLHNRSIDLSLERVADVRDRLGVHPLPCRSIAVAGTNGKGSTVAMLEAVYREHGYQTASYTSPHLVHYNERVRIGSEAVSDGALLDAFRAVEAARGSTPLTYFEFGTLVAAHIICHANVDVALLEVGLGGRLDAVKVLSSDIAIITSIGIDHEAWLGPDRETIGREKAGIMHPGGIAVCAETRCPDSVTEYADSNAVSLWRVNHEFGFADLNRDDGTWRWWCAEPTPEQSRNTETASPVHSPFGVLTAPGLVGGHQYYNAAGVLAVVYRLMEVLPVTAANVARGLGKASLPGRLQVVSEQPLSIVDVAHNVEAVIQLAAYLNTNRVEGRTIAVLGMLEDKPIEECIDTLSSLVDEWYLCDLDVDRGLSAEALKGVVAKRCENAHIRIFDSPVSAWRAARRDADPAVDRLVAFGSFHTVGDILAERDAWDV